jgi:two-component sensor histidine kinase/PAS domain-containing protein
LFAGRFHPNVWIQTFDTFGRAFRVTVAHRPPLFRARTAERCAALLPYEGKSQWHLQPNLILSRLTGSEFRLIEADLEDVDLPVRKVLEQPLRAGCLQLTRAEGSSVVTSWMASMRTSSARAALGLGTNDVVPFAAIGDALAQAIVATVREPLLVLDKKLRVIAASRSFYETFRATREETQGQLLYTLGDGQWDIPALRTLLDKVLPEDWVLEAFEVEYEFPKIGRRTMLLNARTVISQTNAHTALLLAIEDISERRETERELQHLLRQKELLLEEMQHRIANSLQIIASILLMKARSVQSEETRGHLQDAHKRVMSVAAVQQHLQASGHGEAIAVAPYLSKLCETLAQSMIGETRPVALETKVNGGSVVSSEAVSLGLIVIESVINALKHAFPANKTDGRIVVAYESSASGWTLSIADNGVGKPHEGTADAKSGLGTSIVQALANELDASVNFVSNRYGTTVSIRHAPSSSDIRI